MTKLSLPSAKLRAANLRAELNQMAYEYYVLDAPTSSDAIYDSLFGELKQIEAKFPELVTPDSPTQRIAARALDKFDKFRHRVMMISILDVFSDSEAREWLDRINRVDPRVASADFWVDAKMDGLAMALHYDDGQLTRAVTRGDGFTGEVVTDNVRTIRSVPLKLRSGAGADQFLRGHIEIRGEVIMLKKDFMELNADLERRGEKTYANPRNLAAGTIRQLDPRVVASRKLEFHAYDLICDDPAQIPTNQFAYEMLSKLGFRINREAHIEKNFDSALSFAQKFDIAREDLPFNTDGLVIKINDRALFDELGVVGKNPRGVIAYKYPAEQATTRVRDIVISIGRTGAATPVAVFDPVVVAGTTVQHASLHNADEIARLDVRIGDTAVIFKAGDIIPQIESVITNLRPQNAVPFDFEKALHDQYPELEFVRPEGEVVWRLKNADSRLLLEKNVAHYASRAALDIEHLGTKNVEALVRAGLIHDVADLYLLTESQIAPLDGFGELSAANLVAAIAASKTPRLSRFIYALGIRHVGTKTARDLTARFTSVDKLAQATLDDLVDVGGIGLIVAESVVAFFSDPDNEKLLTKLNEVGVRPAAESFGGRLSGQSFAITGTLESMSREVAEEKIVELGGEFMKAVGKSTTYLVAGGKVGASKRAAAEKFGTRIIDENEFLKIIS